MRPLDGCVMLNQNDRESKARLGRGWVEKNRKARKHYFFNLEFDPDNLQIREIAKAEYMDRLNKIRDYVAADVEHDQIHDAGTTKPNSNKKKGKAWKPSDNGENQQESS